MNKLEIDAASAERIVVPKGDDNEPCVAAFQEATGIEVPEFDSDCLKGTSQGRTFWRLKGRDIPEFISAGLADIGLTGSDSCEEYIDPTNMNINYVEIGAPMCRFSLLAPWGMEEAAQIGLTRGTRPLEAATSFPRLLGKAAAAQDLNVIASGLPASGGVEAIPDFAGLPLAADLVCSGDTATANRMSEIRRLCDVYPALVQRDEAKPFPVKDAAYTEINRIDRTLAERSRQITDLAASSYTLELLRDPNKAGKKFGEEVAEAVMDIAGEASTASCESELADVIYSGMVAARSRGIAVQLGNVIRILGGRNLKSTIQTDNNL
jgi:phosphoribosyl-ATP pyrophosphohydrolase